MKDAIANALAESQAQELMEYLLRTIPGLPPIIQTFHIVGICIVVGSIVMINLRFLGIAVPSQNLTEMLNRLMPWMWWALLVNALSGLVFVIARPLRYFYNPVFPYKLALLIPAVILAFLVYRLNKSEPKYWESSSIRLRYGQFIATVSLVLWVGVIIAGRWIAYWDYLPFFYE